MFLKKVIMVLCLLACSSLLSQPRPLIAQLDQTSGGENLDNISNGAGLNESAPNFNSTSQNLNASGQFLPYENRIAGVQMLYPSDWTVNENNENLSQVNDDGLIHLATLSPGGSNSTVLELMIKNLPENRTLPEYLNETINSEREGVNVIDSNTNSTLAEKPAYSLITTETKNNSNYLTMQTGTIIDGKVYIVRYGAKSSDYLNYLPEVQRSLQSFNLSSSVISSIGQSISPSSQYENSISGVRMQYPADWLIYEEGSYPIYDATNVVTFSSPGSAYAAVTIWIENLASRNGTTAGSVTIPSLNQYLSDVLNSPSYNNSRVLESNTNALLAGNPAYTLVTSYTSNGTDYKKMETGTIVGNVTYNITYETDASKYQTFLPQVQKMLDSFQFSSPPLVTSTPPNGYYGGNMTNETTTSTH